jgi:hypothetical protein
MNTLIGANVSLSSLNPVTRHVTNISRYSWGYLEEFSRYNLPYERMLLNSESTCYTLTAGEICPNKYKFLGITFCVIPSCLSTGFGAYIGMQFELLNTLETRN